MTTSGAGVCRGVETEDESDIDEDDVISSLTGVEGSFCFEIAVDTEINLAEQHTTSFGMRTWHGKGELECIYEKLECVPSDAAVTSKDSLKFVWTGCASVKAFQCPPRLLGKSYRQEGFCSLTLSWIHEVGYRPRLATTLKSALVVVMKGY